jgi:hypothetical protein
LWLEISFAVITSPCRLSGDVDNVHWWVRYAFVNAVVACPILFRALSRDARKMGCCVSKEVVETEKRVTTTSSRTDYVISESEAEVHDEPVVEKTKVAKQRPKETPKESKKQQNNEKRLTVRLYSDSLAEMGV